MAQSSPGDTAAAMFMRLSRALLLALCLVGLAGYFLHVQRVAGFPYEIEGWEGNEYLAAIRVASGYSPYGWPSGPEYHVPWYPYGPLQPVLTAAALHLVGRTAGESACTVAISRAISILAGLLTALLIGAIIYRRSGQWGAAAISAALFLSLSPYLRFLTVGRPDSVGILLVMVCHAASESARRPVRLFGVVLGALAAFTKQNFVLLCLPAIAAIYRRDHREGLMALGLLLGVVLTMGTATQVWSGGAFWNNVVTYQARAQGDFLEPEIGTLTHKLQYLLYWVVRFGVLSLAIQVGAVWFLVRSRQRELGPWRGAYWLALGLTLFSFVQWGASTNRMNPAIAVGLVLFGLTISEVHPHRLRNKVEGALAVAVMLVAVAHLAVKSPFTEVVVPTPGYREVMEQTARIVRGAPGPILSEWPLSAVYQARPDAFIGFTLSKPRLSPHAEEMLAALDRDIQDERFAALVLTSPSALLPQRILDVAHARYRLVLDSPHFSLRVYLRHPGGSNMLGVGRRADISRQEEQYRRRELNGWSLFRARKDGISDKPNG